MIAVALAVAGCTEANPFSDVPGTTGDDGGAASSGPTMGSSATTPDSSTGTDTDDAGTVTTDDPSVSGSSTGDPACDSDTRCVPPVPDGGWSGPAALRDAPADDIEPPCGGDYPEMGIMAYSSLEAADADCDCDCAAPLNAACAGVTVRRFEDDDDSCDAEVASWETTSACANTPANMSVIAAFSRWQATAEVSAGTCTPMPSVSIEPAAFASRTTLCRPIEPDAAPACAGDGRCLPAPGDDFDTQLCVWSEGDVACPDPWSDRTVLHQDFADDRGCSACTCGDAEGSCTGTMELFPATNCAPGTPVIATFVVDADGCAGSQSSMTVASARVTGGSLIPVDASCEPSGAEPVGEAEASESLTVCCLPDGG